MSSPLIDFNYKRITEPVHKVIGLSELETRIINGANVFGRLRNIKQLGLAHFVFPGADYSRFSHSIGVCHVAGRVLEILRKNGAKITDREIQLYRLAGLLHDLGHYPFSHAMEHALQDKFAEDDILKPKNDGNKSESTEEPPYKHEHLGKEILEKDKTIRKIIEDYGNGINVSEVSKIFTKTEESRFAKLVSSDLDADRIDYLLRTSYHTGLPYGKVDINHIVGQMRMDTDGKICLSPKALRSADHLFLGRFFDYQQVPFNKTVVALEWLLKDVITELVFTGKIDGSRKTIEKRIENGTWCDFDDAHVIENIKNLQKTTKNKSIKTKAEAILYRIPPKLVAIYESIERLGEDEETTANNFKNMELLINGKIDDWASQFNIDRSLWHIWKRKLRLTADGSRKPLAEGDVARKELVRIQMPDGKSEAIVELRNSLMHTIANYGFFSLRIYVVIPKSNQTLRENVSKKIREDLPTIFK